MRCFIHRDEDAVAVCTKCGKGMCYECSAYLKHSGICPECQVDKTKKGRGGSITLAAVGVVLAVALYLILKVWLGLSATIVLIAMAVPVVLIVVGAVKIVLASVQISKIKKGRSD